MSGLGGRWSVGEGGGWSGESEYPLQLVEAYNPGFSEIELLCLHVGSRVEAESSSLSGFRDQAGIFVNLASWTRKGMRLGQRWKAT